MPAAIGSTLFYDSMNHNGQLLFSQDMWIKKNDFCNQKVEGAGNSFYLED